MFSLLFRQAVSDSAWTDFTSAVREAFWLLPALARPKNVREAGDLFSGTALMIFPHGGTVAASASLTLSPRSLLNGSQHHADTGWRNLHLTDKREAFFARIILVLLHGFCPGFADIRKADAAASWEQPLMWVRHHLCLPALTAPEPEPVSDFAMEDDSIRHFIERYHAGMVSDMTERCWRVICWTDDILPQLRTPA